ncbi:CDP-glycerol glycerophosphotransferase family protein [Macrococcus lamae]|uniref:CDP-glycerol--glycerophosphate glycerophosphotransferase n=1 Tax=Macrococcus lamae TaxID=198484 RepID=A0A4R6BVR6_9STAP|nr:CDP-glycerol glycerophosphotransferase family protein [Macrococcus lamae]TDM12404.1 CDP-glycerol--glycerophosphate glycerophosphotransferase [Macrococcus lamae]
MEKIRIIQEEDTLTIDQIPFRYQSVTLEEGLNYFEKKVTDGKIIINLKDLLNISKMQFEKKINVFLNYYDFKPLEEVVDKLENIDLDKDIFYQNQEAFIRIRKRRRISLKSFIINHNQFHTLEANEQYITPYFDKYSVFSLSLISNIKPSTYINFRHIDKLSFKKSTINLKGKFSLINSLVNKAEIVLESRLTGQFVTQDLNIYKKDISKTKTYNAYYFELNSNLIFSQMLLQGLQEEDIVDLYIQVTLDTYDQPFKFKLGNPRILVEAMLKGNVSIKRDDETIYFTPYFTLKGRNLAFKHVKLTTDSVKAYEKSFKRRKKSKPVWIIGERHYKAQDNGYHFFKYIRENHPEIEAYYVIDKKSNEYLNVKNLGNIVDFRSPEHFEVMTRAEKIFTTHHPELIFPMSDVQYTKSIKAQRIFLQHGVLGTKNLTQINGNQLKDFNVDMFIVSSDREKQIVTRDLQFYPEQVKVTGLSRFDNLFKKITINNQILIIPTWRDWLNSPEKFSDSIYLEKIEELLNSHVIKEMHDQGMEIIFCMHPNMQSYLHLINVPTFIKNIEQGEVDVQQLIKESRLMITDYSSVGFDFSFLYKPVIYYQFDRNRFIGKDGSHLDLERELPGISVKNIENLEIQVKHFAARSFEIDEKLKFKIDSFIKYRDQQSSNRIYQSALEFKNTKKFKNKLKYNIIVQHLFKRFRRNQKIYFNSMKVMNFLLTKFIPINTDLIVFESNVGKSVIDSPKVIYDELSKRNHPCEIVWVTNKIYPFNDEKVKTVKRLSPSYFYYLSRAKFWINNQNLPYYIRKHKNTEYIQTWHGTPLKKMLNDIKVFEGRDENYKNRVNIATRKWDYLISPSQYATEKFTSAFNFNKTMLEIGYPRNDVFYKSNDKFINQQCQIIKQKINIGDDRKIILYAPTFRDDQLKSSNHELNLDFEQLQLLKDDYIILLKPHLLVGNKISIPEQYQDFIYNVSNYHEIMDLYLISDICVTDYSSVMFDFANTRKPLLFYTYDLEHYRDHLRGFYMNFEEEAPGPLLFTTEQIVQSIVGIETVQAAYAPRYMKFIEKYCEYEKGSAAETIVNSLLLNKESDFEK